MAKAKTSIALDEELLAWIDLNIYNKRFASRSHAVEYAVHQLKEREEGSRR